MWLQAGAVFSMGNSCWLQAAGRCGQEQRLAWRQHFGHRGCPPSENSATLTVQFLDYMLLCMKAVISLMAAAARSLPLIVRCDLGPIARAPSSSRSLGLIQASHLKPPLPGSQHQYPDVQNDQGQRLP